MLQQHLEKLHGFYTIAQEGSVLRASQRLGISQPALTKSIQNLENALGAKLFQRHRRGTDLTEAGKVLFNYCEKLFHDLPDLEKKILSPQSMSGVLSIGTYETLGISFWPPALKSLAKAYPELKIKIVTQEPASLWQRLENGALQVIVDSEPPVNEKYFSKILYHDEFGLFASPQMKLEKFEKLPLSFVRWVWDRNGLSIEQGLAQKKVDYEFMYDFDTFVSVKAAALEGLTCAVLPVTFAQKEAEKGKLEEIKLRGQTIRFGEHRVCATCLEDNRRDPRLTAVWKILKQTADERSN